MILIKKIDKKKTLINPKLLYFRYPKVIASAIKHFKNYDLDAIFVATNAPGRSAFNRVERRMAPLNSHLSGLFLPHDKFGNHLDSNGKTIDSELERRNIAAAGEVLATLWNECVIDGYKIFAEFKPPNNNPVNLSLIDVDAKWYSVHVRESQYLLQVIYY